jgi:CubicO group peptidase (beta-lactamase class C family)
MPKLLSLVLLVVLAAPAAAGELPTAKPAEVGLDATKLADIDKRVAKMIEDEEFPGATVAIARNGKLAYLKSFGTFEKDSLIRIYSMTKPITVVAALILMEEGKLSLDDPVSKYLTGFDALKVHRSDKPAKPMTIKDLMRHTSGLSYGLFGNTAVDKAYRKQDVLGKDTTLAEMAKKLSEIPLLFEPGTRWHYSVSIDLLGRVIEVVSQQPFDEYLEARIFKPLGMRDTGFSVPDAKLDRFVPCCGPACRVIEAVETSRFRQTPKMLSGGGGLVSTISDYVTFGLMLDAGGTWNGKRILKPETVKLMTTNQLPDEVEAWGGTGFGLGVSVQLKDSAFRGPAGVWGWGGAASTTFFASPKDRLTVVTMIQRMPMWYGLDRAVRAAVFQALQQPAAPATK